MSSLLQRFQLNAALAFLTGFVLRHVGVALRRVVLPGGSGHPAQAAAVPATPPLLGTQQGSSSPNVDPFHLSQRRPAHRHRLWREDPGKRCVPRARSRWRQPLPDQLRPPATCAPTQDSRTHASRESGAWKQDALATSFNGTRQQMHSMRRERHRGDEVPLREAPKLHVHEAHSSELRGHLDCGLKKSERWRIAGELRQVLPVVPSGPQYPAVGKSLLHGTHHKPPRSRGAQGSASTNRVPSRLLPP
jgi:hypothetical protein